jgi:hypothetical protein
MLHYCKNSPFFTQPHPDEKRRLNMGNRLTVLDENMTTLYGQYVALLRAGFTEEQSLELIKVTVATAMHIAAGQLE